MARPKAKAHEQRLIDKAIAALNLIDRLRERAADIVRGDPFNQRLSEADFARLRLDCGEHVGAGRAALITVPMLEYGFGDDPASLEDRTFEVPIELLFCAPERLRHWQLQEQARRRREMVAAQRAAADARLARDREAYERLKVMFALIDADGSDSPA